MVFINPQRHRVTVAVLTGSYAGSGDVSNSVTLLITIVMMVTRQYQLDIMASFQSFEIPGQVVYFMLVVQNDGNGAIIRLYDKIANPFFLLLSVLGTADDKANSASFEDIMIGWLRMLPMYRFLICSDLPGRVIDYFGIPYWP